MLDESRESDNSLQVNQLIELLDLNRVIESLPAKDKLIIESIKSGYSKKEVIKLYKTNYPYIKRLFQRIAKLLK